MGILNIPSKLLILVLLTVSKIHAEPSACERKEKHLAALDLAKDAISKAKDLQPTCVSDSKDISSNSSECGGKEKVSAYLDFALNLIDNAKENFVTCDESKDITKVVTDEPKDVTTVVTDEPKDVTKVVTDEPKDITTVVTDVPENVTTYVTDEPRNGTLVVTDEPKDVTTVVTDVPENVTTSVTDESRNVTLVVTDEPKDVTTVVTDEPKEITKVVLHNKPIDCSQILENGETKSGEYIIWPRNPQFENLQLKVYCDMDTDGGGWTVIQRRGQFSKKVDFYRNWRDYKKGFGNISEEFWIGNDNIFALTNQGTYTVRFDMQNVDKEYRYATYSSFWIEDEMADYVVHFDKYSGTAGDGISRIKGMPFSTKDQDNGKSISAPCTVTRMGGWWYETCGLSNPNGINLPEVSGDITSMNWRPWTGFYSLLTIEIKIRSEKLKI